MSAIYSQRKTSSNRLLIARLKFSARFTAHLALLWPAASTIESRPGKRIFSSRCYARLLRAIEGYFNLSACLRRYGRGYCGSFSRMALNGCVKVKPRSARARFHLDLPRFTLVATRIADSLAVFSPLLIQLLITNLGFTLTKGVLIP